MMDCRLNAIEEMFNGTATGILICFPEDIVDLPNLFGYVMILMV